LQGLTSSDSPRRVKSQPLTSLVESATQWLTDGTSIANIRVGGTQAYHAIDDSFIRLPQFEFFRDAEGNTATFAHELIH
jgi:antirestriction protein ArdC